MAKAGVKDVVHFMISSGLADTINITRQAAADVKKEYPDFPLGSAIAIIIMLGYSIYPMDIIPDIIIGVGQLDDIGVILACWKLVKSDVEDYRNWLKQIT